MAESDFTGARIMMEEEEERRCWHRPRQPRVVSKRGGREGQAKQTWRPLCSCTLQPVGSYLPELDASLHSYLLLITPDPILMRGFLFFRFFLLLHQFREEVTPFVCMLLVMFSETFANSITYTSDGVQSRISANAEV